MAFELTGKLHEKYDTQQIKDTFKKREFVIETQDGAYQQYIKLQTTQDKVSILDKFKIGDSVKVTFDLRGRPFTDRNGNQSYFTSLEAWRIEGGEGANNSDGMNQDYQDSGAFNPPTGGNSAADDLPF